MLGLSTAAHAADFGGAPAAFDWSGFYAGAQIGHTWSDAELVFVDQDYLPFEPEGISGGLYAGYNIAMQSGFVFGAEIDFTVSDADSEVDLHRNGSPVGTPFSYRAEINWTGAARLRGGYAFDRLLIYAAGGFAAAEMIAPWPEDDLIEETYTGWTVGAGLDYAVTDHLLVRAEYRYSDLGDAEYRGSEAVWFDIELKAHDVRAGIAYKF